MTTLPNMGIVTPTLGGDSGVWDDRINAALALIDAHDHTAGKGIAVPVSGLNINADLPLGGYGLTNLGKIGFSTIAAPSTGSKNLFVNIDDNELYWRTNSGTNVKLTNGASINTALVGGIVGDYAAVGAEVAFDDANKRYTFKDQSSPTKKWARLASGPLRLYEYNSTSTNYVEIACPAAPAFTASYGITLPTSLPGATSIVQITAAGQLSFSNTVAGLVLSSERKFTAYVRTVPVTLVLASRLANIGNTALSGTSTGLDGATTWIASTDVSWEWTSLPLNMFGLCVGDRIKSIRIVHKTIAGTHGWALYKLVAAGAGSGTATLIGSASTLSAADHTDAIGSPAAIATGEQWFLDLTGTTSGDIISHVEITFDHP